MSSSASRSRTVAFFVPVHVPPPLYVLKVDRELAFVVSDEARVSFSQPISRIGRQQALQTRTSSRPYPARPSTRPPATGTNPERRASVQPGLRRASVQPSATSAGPRRAPVLPRAASPGPRRESSAQPRANSLDPVSQPSFAVLERSLSPLSQLGDTDTDTDGNGDTGSEGERTVNDDGESERGSHRDSTPAPSRELTPHSRASRRSARNVRFDSDVVPVAPDDGLIPEPGGTAGRPESGGFNLREEMQVSQEAYKVLKVSVE